MAVQDVQDVYMWLEYSSCVDAWMAVVQMHGSQNQEPEPELELEQKPAEWKQQHEELEQEQ